MTDMTDTPKPSRGGSGAVIGRLAVGALLSAPLAAAAVTAAAQPAAAAAPEAVIACSGTSPASVRSIREQFASSFTAGAVKAPSTSDLITIICDK